MENEKGGTLLSESSEGIAILRREGLIAEAPSSDKCSPCRLRGNDWDICQLRVLFLFPDWEEFGV